MWLLISADASAESILILGSFYFQFRINTITHSLDFTMAMLTMDIWACGNFYIWKEKKKLLGRKS